MENMGGKHGWRAWVENMGVENTGGEHEWRIYWRTQVEKMGNIGEEQILYFKYKPEGNIY